MAQPAAGHLNSPVLLLVAKIYADARQILELMDVRQSLYFVPKEALNNLLKYAGATKVQVKISQQEGKLQASVSDNGCGFDPLLTDNRTGGKVCSNGRRPWEQLPIDFTRRVGTSVGLTVPLR